MPPASTPDLVDSSAQAADRLFRNRPTCFSFSRGVLSLFDRLDPAVIPRTEPLGVRWEVVGDADGQRSPQSDDHPPTDNRVAWGLSLCPCRVRGGSRKGCLAGTDRPSLLRLRHKRVQGGDRMLLHGRESSHVHEVSAAGVGRVGFAGIARGHELGPARYRAALARPGQQECIERSLIQSPRPARLLADLMARRHRPRRVPVSPARVPLSCGHFPAPARAARFPYGVTLSSGIDAMKTWFSLKPPGSDADYRHVTHGVR